MPENTVFILAAGFGTRLRPLTLHRPKPLLPLLGRPMIDHALAWLRRHGHRHIMVNAHHLWEKVAEWAEKNNVELQVELPEILGTGGGLKAAESRLADRFLIWNGDIVSDIDPQALLDACPIDGAAMALRHADALGKTTPLARDDMGRVSRIGDLTQGPQAPDWQTRPTSGLHFTGIHAMHKKALDWIPSQPALRCVVRRAYVELVPRSQVNAIVHGGCWRDTGTPPEYLEANLDALDGVLPVAEDSWSTAHNGPGNCWVHESATVSGDISHSIIGANATIPPAATLVDCVVWDGVSVPDGVHKGAIFHDGGCWNGT